NVEKYIERCAESLFGQTLKEVEYIFVNDCTPDKSIDILNAVIERYPERKSHIKIINHEKNRGLAAGRNTGLEIASGEYIFHCDSDDCVDVTFCEKMYNTAIEKNADIVWCDIYESDGNNNILKAESFVEDREQCIKLMLSYTMKWNIWNKIFRRSLYIENDIKELEGNNLGEDLITIKLFFFAHKVAYCPQGLYYYNTQNTSSYTNYNNITTHYEEVIKNVNSLTEFLIANDISKMLDKEIDYLQLWIKNSILARLVSRKTIKQYCNMFPQANKSILNYEKLNIFAKIRLIMAKYGCVNLIKFYNYLLCLFR
ncbi:MAG: glycosyltransferase, partial [Bacteroidales bacterium]|nr:glycosyltransferase [Bacteroidales bacterium]